MEHNELTEYHKSDFDKKDKQFLGCGSFGKVLLVYHKRLQNHVVVKVISASGDKSDIKKQLAEAEKEAKIHAKFKHKNIVKILGKANWDEYNVALILEFVPCGSLEGFLNSENDISWKLRARFFTEIADAVDYLHNHDPKIPYVHGDLKPQNVLLGDLLQIKLADFGAAAIAKVTGAAASVSSGDSNTQHTIYYAAPEYLTNPHKRKQKSMDVYSFGMIGYEIVTERTVFTDSEASIDIVKELIKAKGQKPNIQFFKKVKKKLSNGKGIDLEIFYELKDIVEKCWEYEAQNRPKISEIKSILNTMATSKEIYDDETNNQALRLSENRKASQGKQSINESIANTSQSSTENETTITDTKQNEKEKIQSLTKIDDTKQNEKETFQSSTKIDETKQNEKETIQSLTKIDNTKQNEKETIQSSTKIDDTKQNEKETIQSSTKIDDTKQNEETIQSSTKIDDTKQNEKETFQSSTKIDKTKQNEKETIQTLTKIDDTKQNETIQSSAKSNDAKQNEKKFDHLAFALSKTKTFTKKQWIICLSFVILLLAVGLGLFKNFSNYDTPIRFVAVLKSHQLIKYDIGLKNYSVLS